VPGYQTLTPDQARAAVKAAAAERDAIQANLVELDRSFGHRLLAGATLTGQTKQRWEEAAAALATLWQVYSAYSAVVDQAAEAVRRHLGPKELVAVTALLAGPSVSLAAGPAPLASRDLADTGLAELTLAAAVARMRRAFTAVTELISAAEQVWNEAAGRLDAAAAWQRVAARIAPVPPPLPPGADVSARLAGLQTLLAGGRWVRLGSELDLLERELADATAAARDAERALVALLATRDELRGLLEAYRAKAARMGAAEDPALAGGYDHAHELLWTAPCDLTAAADAVTGYQQAVLALGGQRR
jgi:hypothetical protein